MKKHRFFALLSAAVCTVFALSGCAGKTSGENGTRPPVLPDPPITEPPEDEKKPIDRTDIFIDDGDDKPIPPPYEFDDSVKYDYSGVTYTNRWGGFTDGGGAYTGIADYGNLALCEDPGFPYGTISCTVRSNDLVDTGIIFCASETGDVYDEAEMSYYFYFLGMGGSAYLGKWNGPKNEWQALTVVSLGKAVDPDKEYELKVILKANNIACFMDGELMFGFKDKEFLTGTGFGMRVNAHPDVNASSSAAGVTISDLTVSSGYIVG